MNTRANDTDGPGKPLTSKQLLLAQCVGSGASVKLAAERARVPLRSARRWSALPEFRRVVGDVRQSVLAEAAGRLQAASVRAVITLERLLRSQDGSLALRAAEAILNQQVRMSEHLDLARQLAELKEAVERAEAKNQHGGRY